MRSGGGGILGEGLGTSFVSVHGSKIIVSKGSVCKNLVDITGGDTDMSALVEEDVTCNGKEPVKLWGGGAAATNIMEFWTMERYAVVFLICVSVVEVKSITGGNKISGKLLLDGSEDLEDSSL